MSIINMLRGGAANGDNRSTFSHNMYPRPDYLLEDMAENIGWENSKDSFHLVHKFNACECHTSGAVKRAKNADDSTDSCCIEQGDEIPLVWIPNRATLEAVTLAVNNGIAGVEVGIRRYTVADGQRILSDATLVGPHLAGSDAGPLPSATITQAEIDDLGCNDRLDMSRFCGECENGGCFYQEWLPAPVLVGGCAPEGQYLSLVIETLPDDFDCSSCCLDIDVGARVRIARCGD